MVERCGDELEDCIDALSDLCIKVYKWRRRERRKGEAGDGKQYHKSWFKFRAQSKPKQTMINHIRTSREIKQAMEKHA